jgi:pantetheine-phosphate adenylyltransferase
MKKKAVFPGSFDPPTLGHINLIERAAGIFGEVLVAVAENSQKKSLFSAQERLSMLECLTAALPNVKVFTWPALMTDFMKQHSADILVRGIRGGADFAYEFEISCVYKGINPTIETVFIPTDPRFLMIRSSTVKELASFHVDVSGMVPPLVAEALKVKFSS